ncbi:efflux transporter outer membrane subunit [Roseateles sp. BYS180W]|uniref:Efflux transporter outer membrane subunit n=1 Tax=Roseateles rivi TaxID=3299028 RepID=A0ABW7FSC9_9BURK
MKDRTRHRARRVGLWMSAGLAVWILGGCAHKPLPTGALQGHTPADWAARASSAQTNPAPAWERMDDAVLRQLVAWTWTDQPGLQQAVARLDEARALAGASAAASGLNATGQWQRGRQAVPAGLPIQNISLGQFDASWELDLFGRARQLNKASSLRAEASALEVQALRLSLATETAELYLSLRAAEQLVALGEQELASANEVAKLSRQRQQVGLEASASSALLQGAAAEAQQRLLAQRAQREQLLKALAALTAHEEAQLRSLLARSPGAWPQLGAPFAVAVPAQALQQRPDVAAAQTQALAAWAAAGAAEAARWPQLSLVGSFSVAGIQLGGATDESRGWGFGPRLTLPLLDGGRARAEAQAAQARWRQAEAAWRGAVLQAVREVEDALVRLDAAQQRQAPMQQSLQAYEQALVATQQRWQAGFASAQELEDQRRVTLGARAAMVQLQREQRSAWLALHKAVGGGWQAPLVSNSQTQDSTS